MDRAAFPGEVRKFYSPCLSLSVLKMEAFSRLLAAFASLVLVRFSS